MDFNLNNKNAIITGGSAGIGLAIAQAFVKEGANVIIVGRELERLKRAEEEIKKVRLNDKCSVFTISGDLSKKEDISNVIEKTVSHCGKIDILVNNAGSARAGSFFDLTDQDFEEAWNLKFLGYIRMVKGIAPFMIKQRDGNIINIIGIAARNPSATFLPGSTTNAAILNFTKGLSKELAAHNVRINAISPGVTATERAERLAIQRAQAKGISLQEEKEGVYSSIPLRKYVDPDEIAKMTLLLCSNSVSSITGTEFIIDGGQTTGV
ncbi:short-chain dehydrogenase [Bacillus sp. M6-12]|uniref:SDR family NAD(P)-dependent oxidoreductase n=1 Tax=Bacillus sp. M6-12 TaxID=2054166 RepID=UPI000C793724|nr:SDR family NAD(P)-dependent oxidoreductase [Bacillus sp. M6-12]PLS18531.1 short-chain dehydrogenase [Bacillus sp. M6-12]